MAADITNQFTLSRDGRTVSGFLCNECARKIDPNTDPESVRMLHVWWVGKPREEGPMQLRLTGVGAETVRDGPSDAGPDKKIPQIVQEVGDPVQKTRLRFRCDEEISRGIWSSLCDPAQRI